MKIRNYIALISLIVSVNVYAQANECASVYKGAVQRIQYQNSQNAWMTSLYRNTCSSENRDIRVGFDQSTKSIVNSIPVISESLFRLGINNNKQFCEYYESHNISASQTELLVVEPLSYAQQNFNQCIAVYQRDQILISHENPDPSLVTISVRFTSPDRFLRVNGIESNGGFQCKRSTAQGARPLGVERPFDIRSNETFFCRRAPSQSKGDFVFPPASIAFGGSTGAYVIKIPETTVLGPESRREANEMIASEKQNTASQVADNAALRAAMENPTVEVKFAYSGEKREPCTFSRGAAVCGQYFNCAQSNPDYIKSSLCPSSSVVRFTKWDGHGGNQCGYSYYVATCINYPK